MARSHGTETDETRDRSLMKQCLKLSGRGFNARKGAHLDIE